MNAKTQQTIISVIAAVALGATLLACGLAACCLPQATNFLSANTSAFELSPYEPSELTALADTTRDFTIDDYGRSDFGEEGARAVLCEKIIEAARASAAEDSPTSDRWTPAARAVLDKVEDQASFLGESSDSEAAAFADATAMRDAVAKLAALDQAYALDDAALSHLTDVNDVISRVTWALIGVAVLAAFCLMVSMRSFGAQAAGRALMWAGGGIVVLLVLLGAWALIGFESFFAAFHSLFFAEGTWTFPYDSLLICMYPTAFWMGMGAIWLVTTGALSILSLVSGRMLVKRAHEQAATAGNDPLG